MTNLDRPPANLRFFSLARRKTCSQYTTVFDTTRYETDRKTRVVPKGRPAFGFLFFFVWNESGDYETAASPLNVNSFLRQTSSPSRCILPSSFDSALRSTPR